MFWFRRCEYHAKCQCSNALRELTDHYILTEVCGGMTFFLFKIQQPINFATLEQHAPCAAQQILFPLVIIGQ